MTNRRKFIKQVTVGDVAATVPSVLFSQGKLSKDIIWAYMVRLGYNHNRGPSVPFEYRKDFTYTNCEEARRWIQSYRPNLNFDDSTWDIMLKEMADAGINMVVIFLGDGVRYDSHPEIAVKNAWATDKLKKELAKIRQYGIEPIPKLNFSTAHHIWLGKYARMVSSEIYYDVCSDIINEVCALFDYPRFFHLGMDEEKAPQTRQEHVVLRQHDLWWGDLYFFIGEVEKNGVRSWIWSDYGWWHPDVFFRKMPKSVMLSNWYYGSKWDWKSKVEPEEKYPKWRTYVKMYDDLEEHGYDQLPTGSNHSNDQNFEATVDYCKKVIDPSRLYGFMTTPWRPVLAPCLEKHKEAINQVGIAINNF